MINKKIVRMGLLLLASFNLHSTLTLSDDVGTIIDLKDFEYLHDQLSPISIGQEKTYKELYRSQATGETWLVSKAFNGYNFRYYLAGEVYRLLLADNVVPEVRLMRDKQNQLRLGSKIIPGFTNLADFFKYDVPFLKRCFPSGCLVDTFLIDSEVESSSMQQRITIQGAEAILAAMLFVADFDGKVSNLGLISQPELGTYRVGKVDHEETFACLVNKQFPLRSLSKIVFGERHQYAAALNYEKFDLDLIADSFDQFAKIDSEILTHLYAQYLTALQDPSIDKSNWSPDLQSLELEKVITFQLSILKQRLNLCSMWAKSLRLEAAIRNNSLQNLIALVQDGSVDPNDYYEYLFLETAAEVPHYTLTEMCGMISEGNTELMYSELIPYLYAEKPISPLEMAMRYDRPLLVQYLLSVSDEKTVRDTLNNIPATYEKYKVVKELIKILG